MIEIAVVEDDAGYVEQLTKYLQQYADESGKQIHTTVFRDGDEIAESYHGGFDLILMDIEMQFMDGMTAAEKIREIDRKVMIIFITNMAQYAIRGYAVDALDYILKPISYFAFSQRLERALDRIETRGEKFYTIRTKRGTCALPVKSIYWVESQGHRLTYVTAQGNFEATSDSMKKVEEALREEDFFRCNNCYLVNLAHVKGIHEGGVTVCDTVLQISRAKKNDFLLALTNYASKRS